MHTHIQSQSHNSSCWLERFLSLVTLGWSTGCRDVHSARSALPVTNGRRPLNLDTECLTGTQCQLVGYMSEHGLTALHNKSHQICKASANTAVSITDIIKPSDTKYLSLILQLKGFKLRVICRQWQLWYRQWPTILIGSVDIKNIIAKFTSSVEESLHQWSQLQICYLHRATRTMVTCISQRRLMRISQ